VAASTSIHSAHDATTALDVDAHAVADANVDVVADAAAAAAAAAASKCIGAPFALPRVAV